MKIKNILGLLMCGSISVGAHAKAPHRFILAVGYSDQGRVIADIDEDEVDPDMYANYALDVDRARSIQLVLPDYHLYAHYMRMDASDEQGQKYSNRFNSMAIGFASEMREYLTDSMHGYLLLEVGAGVARFNFDSLRSRAMGEAGAEVGLLFFRRISVGVGLGYQLIGYPSETIAEGVFASANLGLRL